MKVRWLAALLCVLAAPSSRAHGADRYALVVTGASGGPQYGERYDRWRAEFVQTLRDGYGYPDDHLFVLAESEGTGVKAATGENVRQALAEIGRRAVAADVVTVLLIGHGASVDGAAARFNLVGPDLSPTQWAALLRPIAARVVFIDTASGSFAYLATLAGRNRLVITANDTTAQQYETVLPEFMVGAFGDQNADGDKNGRVSVWEAFAFASAKVKEWFEQRGQLATERALLDDNGDGTGREAGKSGTDGLVAQAIYLEPEAEVPPSEDPEVNAWRRRRAALESEIEQLRLQKATIAPDDYERALEPLLLELAQLDRRLRR